MLYLFQVNIYMALMIAVYLLLLRNRPIHQFSRLYLLLCTVIPPVLPFIILPQQIRQQLQGIDMIKFELPEVIIEGAGSKLTNAHSSYIVYFIYILVCVILIALQSRNYYHIWHLTRVNNKEKHQQYTLITECGKGPGSFGNYIFFPGVEVNEAILAHEEVHVRLKHSWDIIFINIVQAAMWPNVLLAWIKKEIREIHEFQADGNASINKEDYVQLILSTVFGMSGTPAMHSFIIHPIKRRIMMLQKSVPVRKKTIAAIVKTSTITVAILAGIVYLQSCSQKKESPFPTAEEVGKEDAAGAKVVYDTINATKLKIQSGQHYIIAPGDVKVTIGEEILEKAEVMPEPGYDFNKFLIDNIRFPESAKNKRIEGRVILKFVVNEKGEITLPTIVRSPDTALASEALRIAKLIPTWKPAKQNGKNVSVFFTLPIWFKLS